MTPPVDLHDLIHRVAARDTGAFGQLYDATSGYVLGLLRRMLADGTMAEEVAQEVYVQVGRTAATFDPARASAWSWLALAARSRAIDRLRAERSYRGALDGLELDPLTGGGAGSPEQHAILAERGALVRVALADLVPAQRRALELAFFGGLSHSEIAEQTETPLGTVKTRIRTALQRLERSLRPAVSP